eukprot:g22022.t1
MSLLYEQYLDHFQRGQQALTAGRKVDARRELLMAGRCILRLAQEANDPEMAGARKRKGMKLLELAKSLPESSSPASTSGAKPTRVDGGDDETAKRWERIDKPNIFFKDIAGLDNVKNLIRRRVIYPFQNPDLAEKYGRKPGGGVLMYGPPGTGKTMMAKAVATELDAPFYNVLCSDIMSKWVGEAEQNLNDLLATARAQVPAVIFLDETEALIGKRGGNSTVMNRLIPEFLAQIDGVSTKQGGLLLLGATNRPWDIDPAALRHGRFGEHVYIGLSDQAARRFILEMTLAKIPLQPDVDLDAIAERTEGLSGADLNGLVDRIVDPAFDEAMASGKQVAEAVQDLVKQVPPTLPETEVALRPTLVLPLKNDRDELVTKALRQRLSEDGRYRSKELKEGLLDQILAKFRDSKKDVTIPANAIELGKDAEAEVVIVGVVEKLKIEGPSADLAVHLDMYQVSDGAKIFSKSFTTEKEPEPAEVPTPVSQSPAMKNGGLVAGLVCFAIFWPLLLMPAMRRVIRAENNAATAAMLTLTIFVPLAVGWTFIFGGDWGVWSVLMFIVAGVVVAFWTIFVMNPRRLFAAAQESSASGEYDEAMRLLKQIPAEQRSSDHERIEKQVGERLAEIEELTEGIRAAMKKGKSPDILLPMVRRLVELKPGDEWANDLRHRLENQELESQAPRTRFSLGFGKPNFNEPQPLDEEPEPEPEPEPELIHEPEPAKDIAAEPIFDDESEEDIEDWDELELIELIPDDMVASPKNAAIPATGAAPPVPPPRRRPGPRTQPPPLPAVTPIEPIETIETKEPGMSQAAKIILLILLFLVLAGVSVLLGVVIANGIGYHFVIGNGNGMNDGEIEPTFRWRTQMHGAHAGNLQHNQYGIGIALIGNFEKAPPTAAQLAAVKRLVATLKREYAIDGKNVLGHSKIRATACPGRYFPLAEVSGAGSEYLYGGIKNQHTPVRLARFNERKPQ